MSIERGMDEKDVVHIYNAILFSQKKKRSSNAICSNMNAIRDYHPKWSKPEKERQIQYDITYMWNLKYGTNELIYKTETDLYAKSTDLWLPWGRVGLGVWG